MAETINKPKLQLRSGLSFNGDKTPSPATKLLINHGKPNFTIQRSPKTPQNSEGNPLSPQVENHANSNNNNISSSKFSNNNNNNTNTNEKAIDNNVNGNNDIIVKSTKLNGVFKAANVPITPKQPHQQTSTENEAAKVVLRRTKIPEPAIKEGEDESVPEFIRRQRRIQERLAKENILDFENRRSGYFTHCIVSPSSTNRTSFAETMASPAVVPSLEIPPPPSSSPSPNPPTTVEESAEEIQEPQQLSVTTNGESNGHVEEEEVIKAIEEVNKAVAGEDDEKLVVENEKQVSANVSVPVVAVAPKLMLDDEAVPASDHHPNNEELVTQEHPEVVATKLEYVEEVKPPTVIEEAKQNGHMVEVAPLIDLEPEQSSERAIANGNANITISHTNNGSGPSIPAPDPSGALGVNFEPKTVVSFSKDLGSEPNKYPDTVKMVKDGAEPGTPGISDDLHELTKLKFDIKADEQDVQVTPVLRTE